MSTDIPLSPSKNIFKNYPLVHQIKKTFWEAPADALFSRAEVALLIGYSVRWLIANDSLDKGGIPFKKAKRKCYYSKSDIEAWLKRMIQRNGKSDPN